MDGTDDSSPENKVQRQAGAGSESSGDDPSTTNGTGDRGSETQSSSEVDLTRTETRAVKRSKALVYLVLLLATIAVGTITYILTYNDETKTFHQSFKTYAGELVRNANSNAKAIAGQVKNLGTGVTSVALTLDMSWPNVSFPHFDKHAREAEDLTGIELLMFSPIVPYDEKDGWEEYAWEHQDWIRSDLKLIGAQDVDPGNISRHIYSYDSMDVSKQNSMERHLIEVPDLDIYVPVWQLGPVPSNASIINLDLNTHPSFKQTVFEAINSDHVMLSAVVNLDFLLMNSLLNHTLDSDPRSYILEPVMDTFSNDSKVVGFVVADLKWRSFFMDLLPSSTGDILVVVHGTCDGNYTYMVSGHQADFVAFDDDHSSQYHDLEQVYDFADFARYSDESGVGCMYTLSVYPTPDFEAPYHTNKPAVYTAVVVLIFCCTAACFFVYDYMVHVRQQKLHAKARRTNKIVASMFPKEFQDRILQDEESMPTEKQFNRNKRLKDVLAETDADAVPSFTQSKPIADLFAGVTIMFADVVGFTSWASMREPSQVFMLLETIFHEFDMIAHRRKVFKVETVGDCYVAVCGLPEPRKDNAVVMARFARDCLFRFSVVTKQLENVLGPDTSELGMRFGLHSGSVTAGVLRGERSRFQLFGDAMNTAARIESTGARNKIQISLETAELLASHGKGHWCIPREDNVVAKGKGELKTYWLVLKGDNAQSSRSGSSSGNDGPDGANVPHVAQAFPNHQNRVAVNKAEKLAKWNAEILVRYLKEIVAMRTTVGIESDPVEVMRQLELGTSSLDATVLDEVTDVVDLPEFKSTADGVRVDPATVELPVHVAEQLRDYVVAIGNLYRENSFHSFEHASHVTMSAVKLLSRIVAPDMDSSDGHHIHDHACVAIKSAIQSDALTQFAVVLSALVHDLDHTGVPNSTLIKEQATVAAAYKNKSVAEQNSVDIAWELLMQPEYADLRRTIYANEAEFRRFRQLLINLVLATDIMDKDLGTARKARWSRAFAEGAEDLGSGRGSAHDRNFRANIVLEHLIQASDVAHTMQHFTIYRKWNEALFEEMYQAYRDGRSDRDPSENWYEGEIGFFDYYVIPLAKKLKDCGVFGVSSDEYLDYAEKNRREWQVKGREIVREMVESKLHPAITEG